MGEVILLSERRRARERGASERPPAASTLFFDLGSPQTYFAAERADRLFSGLAWVPALLPPTQGLEDRQAVTRRARELRMPLVWPEVGHRERRAAMRVASFAAEQGQGAAFVLAASRLAFCGGFDLDDPEILAEAVAAAALPLAICLEIGRDASRDADLEAVGRRLAADGVVELPVLQVDDRRFVGEARIAEAAAVARRPAAPAFSGPFGGATG